MILLVLGGYLIVAALSIFVGVVIGIHVRIKDEQERQERVRLYREWQEQR